MDVKLGGNSHYLLRIKATFPAITNIFRYADDVSFQPAASRMKWSSYTYLYEQPSHRSVNLKRMAGASTT